MLRHFFVMFLPNNTGLLDEEQLDRQGATLDPNERLDPSDMKKMHEKMGLDVEYPSIYAMLCWMTEANKSAGSKGLNFEEFVQ